ncbi:hypothetical protein COCVIDRAFT_43139 [Bipolaris victoriae FI3]|uniref:DUF7779 domain-containing protein n=1 Tax=Bipolaris victoriae (strain FI3) TaxID=930091 RepID=W7E9H2_BIPV3|nr:hypothetical protein COCVIDRAFT_43139 [Bipolaris victoriae FI3]
MATAANSMATGRLYTDSKPMVIVCYSLGGIIVKQALCIANKQFYRYGLIVNALAGIIFLSTPHCYADKTACAVYFREILELIIGRGSKVINAIIEREGAILLDLADRFEGISLRTPMLSAYKLRESRISSTPLPTEWPSNRATKGTTPLGFELVHSAAPNTEPKKFVHLPCVLLNINLKNENFYGRKDILACLAAELLPSKSIVTALGTALQQFVICGFGGIGKTEIAPDEIAKLDHHYQQISLALGLEDPSECKSQVVSREIQLSGYDELGQPDQARLEATWLLVFDNADDPMILADYWPQGSGSILITSRDPLAKRIFTGRTLGLDLGPLTQQDSLSLFNHLTPISNESEMAGVICRQDLILPEFLELYTDHEEHSNLYETKFDANLITYSYSLSTVWAFEKLKPHARQLLELISFLDPDFIGEDLLIEASVTLLSDGAQFRKIHRIVQEVIMTTMDEFKKRSMFNLIVRTLWADWPSAMPKPLKEPELPQPKLSGGRLHVGRWPVCAAIYPYVLRIHQLWSTISDLLDATKLHFAKLLNEAAWYQKERGRTKDFDGFFETARSICESSVYSNRDSLLADIYFCLGAISMDVSDFDKSRVCKELSFALVSNICKELGTADERLYLAYAEQGEADLREALRIRIALGNYVPRSGERVMRHMRATVGEKDFYTANVAYKIAEYLLRLGRSEESITMANMALDIWSVDLSAHKNEIARTTFLKGRLFEVTVACRLRKEITQEDRDMNSLTTEDFDKIVAFWAR